MKNTLWEIGGWRMTNPHIVVKLGFALDTYKLPKLKELWKVNEAEAKKRLGKFDAKDLFHEETMTVGELTYSFRWYTPASNRTKIEPIKPNEEML